MPFRWCSILLALLAACSNGDKDPRYTPSAALPSCTQDSFAAYQQATRQWLRHNRVFVTTDPERELTENSPFELRPPAFAAQRPRRGILLMHGLSDSPGYLRNVAASLAEAGWLVRVLLTPGHGSRPADLMLANHADWQACLKHQSALLKQDVDTLWIGGFSTGANLAAAQAMHDDSVSGVLLFSPPFAAKNTLIPFTPWLEWLSPWATRNETAQNPLRYDALATHGVAQFHASMQDIQQKLSREHFSKPAILVLAAEDEVIPAEKVYQLFHTRFTHPASRLLWFGTPPKGSPDARLIPFPDSFPKRRISHLSHLSLIFAPEHPLYGASGNPLLLDNEQKETPPVDPERFWFGPAGYHEPGKYHARQSWNPLFVPMMTTIEEIMNKASKEERP